MSTPFTESETIMTDRPTTPTSSGPTSTGSTSTATSERLAAIDGILGSAGHRVTDPALRAILRRQIASEITGDQARELIREHEGMA